MIPHTAFHIAESDYNVGMDETPKKTRVIESRPRDHVRNLSVHVGDVIGVGHRNQQYPEMRWCTPEHGYSGWMAESYFDYTSDTEAVVTKDYDASQLTVIEGEELEVLDIVGEWWLCRNDRGIQGWVPHRILRDVTPGDS
jgi:hypothetical protein